VLRKYVEFDGRAGRSEYWYFQLFNLLILVVIGFVSGIIEGIVGTADTIADPLILLYLVVVFLPSLTVSVRRLHDLGKSGTWLLLSLIPFFGSLILLLYFCQDSQPGTNEYGVNPKEAF
jgi:uncharacterized membrane protein YhaH (DUF805 family)